MNNFVLLLFKSSHFTLKLLFCLTLFLMAVFLLNILFGGEQEEEEDTFFGKFTL